MFMDRKIYKAAVEGKIDVLVEEQAELNRLLTPRKNTILHVHILARPPTMESTEFLQEALEMCPSLLLQANIKGEIPLHVAAKYGHHGVVKALIERAKSMTESTSHNPAQTERKKTSSRFKQRMLRMTNNEKDTALHEAVRMNHIDVVKLLIAEDRRYSYPGNAAGETPLYLAVERGYDDIADEILERCRSPAHGGRNGRTTLHAAVMRENSEMMSAILEKTGSALTSKVDEEGWTPLHHSTQNGSTENLEMLLETSQRAAYVASKDKQWTPLHVAVRTGSVGMVEELILQCPDCVELVDRQGWNVLHHAIDRHKGRRRVSFLLEDPVISKLLNDKDTHGNTPVHLVASTINKPEYSKDFFTAAPLVDKNALNDLDQTPLDILLEVRQLGNDVFGKRSFIEEMESNGFKQSMANKIEGKKATKPQIQLRWDEEVLEKKRHKAKKSNLWLAALIATLTFAIRFISLLGDYTVSSDREGGRPRHDHHDQGLQIFSRKTAFQAFVVCHTVATLFSICGVYAYVLMSAGEEGKDKFATSFFRTYLLSIIAMAATVLAFASGAYLLLGYFTLLIIFVVIIIIIIIIIIILLFYFYFKGRVHRFYNSRSGA